jgi:hypothetical protein
MTPDLAEQILMTAGAGMLGASIGSFVNVCIYRWPRGLSVAAPKRSFCPSCREPIRALDNIPVLSWLLLRGRCRHCRSAIPVSYFLIEFFFGPWRGTCLREIWLDCCNDSVWVALYPSAVNFRSIGRSAGFCFSPGALYVRTVGSPERAPRRGVSA